MPEFFSAVHATGTAAAPFTPYDWSAYNSDMIYRIDLSNTSCYPGSGTTVTSLATGAATWAVTGGPSFNTSGNAKYFNFDGVNDGMCSNTNFSYGTVTMNYGSIWAYWIRQGTAPANTIMTLGGIDDDGNIDLIYWDVRVNAGGTNYGVGACLNSSIPNRYVASLTPGQWQFICFHFNHADAVIKTYLNGSLVDNWVFTGSGINVNVGLERYVIGGRNGSGTQVNSNWWKGDIAEAFLMKAPFYPWADPETRIVNIYNGTKGRYGL